MRGLYLITQQSLAAGRSTVEVVREALQGGAQVVQLRDKGLTARELLTIGEQVRQLTRAAGVPLIINDRVDLAIALDADGVHLGQDDIPAPVARRLLGPGKIIGVSAGNVEQALRAVTDGADYLGIGPVYGTTSKTDARLPVGPEMVAAVRRAVKLPVVAIGGISLANLGAVALAGADAIAVISAVVSAPAVREAAAAIQRHWTQLKEDKQ